MDEVPIKYRLMYSLLANHSIVDTSKIIGISRSVIFLSYQTKHPAN